MKAAGVFVAGTVGGIALMVWTVAVLFTGIAIGEDWAKKEKKCKCGAEIHVKCEDLNASEPCVENPEGETECQQ